MMKHIIGKIRNNRFLKTIKHYYPFSILGTILFFVSVFIMGKSYNEKDPYGFFLSLVALFILLLFVALSRLQAASGKSADIQWDTSHMLHAYEEGAATRLYVRGIKPYFFFRMHFKIAGRLGAGRNADIFIRQEISASIAETASGEIPIPAYYPSCGILKLSGVLSICDIFGLTRARFKEPFLKTMTVRPSRMKPFEIEEIKAEGGFENKSKQKHSDEERYYMREYQPGDRLKDINWKATSRMSRLITRISQTTQEKIKLLHVYFRNYKRSLKETLDSVAHLNYLKSWLLCFLRTVKTKHPEYQFKVIAGLTIFEVETLENIDDLEVELSRLHFQNTPLEIETTGPGEAFIFTTPYDDQMPVLLTYLTASTISIFRTAGIQSSFQAMTRKIIFYRFLKSHFLPGFWALQRDRLKRAFHYSKSSGINITENALDVQLYSFL